MISRRIFLLFAYLAQSTAVCADRLGGEPFGAPCIVWQSVHPGWIERPITPTSKVKDADLVITLDQQLYPFLTPAIQTYANTHGLTIAVSNGTCGISAGLLRKKAVDIGGFCCAPRPRDRLPSLRFHTLAIAAITLLVHPDNPVEDLTLAQARGLFGGQITNWSQILDDFTWWGASLAVHPIARLHCPVRPGHWRLLLDHEDLFGVHLSEVGAIEDMVRKVAADPQAIGYETLWMTRYHDVFGEVKPVRLNGVRPNDIEALAEGRYPLYRVYNLTTWEGDAGKPLARKLVRYLLDRIQEPDSRFSMVSVDRLRVEGWRFEGGELVGEPAAKASRVPPRNKAERVPSAGVNQSFSLP